MMYNGHQVMAKVDMAFDQVRQKLHRNWIKNNKRSNFVILPFLAPFTSKVIIVT